jgi:hypothetical protein
MNFYYSLGFCTNFSIRVAKRKQAEFLANTSLQMSLNPTLGLRQSVAASTNCLPIPTLFSFCNVEINIPFFMDNLSDRAHNSD